jgi:hypothetical protein
MGVSVGFKLSEQACWYLTRTKDNSALIEPVLSLARLEDCSDQEEDKTRNRGNHSDGVERLPAIAKLLPVVR